MVGDYTADNGQPKAGSRLFCGKIRFEQTGLVLGRDAGAIVGNGEGRHLQLGVIPAADRDLPLLLHGRHGILQEVDDHPLDLVPVDHDLGKVFVGLEQECHPAVRFLVERQGLADQGIEVVWLRLDRRHAGKIGKLVDQVFQLIHRLDDHLGAFVKDRLIAAEARQVAFPQPLGRKLDRRERILDLVGDAPGHLAPGRHALGLHHLGHVVQHQHRPQDFPLLIAQHGQVKMQRQAGALDVQEDLPADGILP